MIKKNNNNNNNNNNNIARKKAGKYAVKKARYALYVYLDDVLEDIQNFIIDKKYNKANSIINYAINKINNNKYIYPLEYITPKRPIFKYNNFLDNCLELIGFAFALMLPDISKPNISNSVLNYVKTILEYIRQEIEIQTGILSVTTDEKIPPPPATLFLPNAYWLDDSTATARYKKDKHIPLPSGYFITDGTVNYRVGLNLRYLSGAHSGRKRKYLRGQYNPQIKYRNFFTDMPLRSVATITGSPSLSNLSKSWRTQLFDMTNLTEHVYIHPVPVGKFFVHNAIHYYRLTNTSKYQQPATGHCSRKGIVNLKKGESNERNDK